MNLRHCLPLLSILALAGCAGGPAVQSSQPDSLTVHINNEAQGTMVMRGGSLEGFASPRCDGQNRLANKISMSSEETLANVPVTPGQPFTFAVSTLNAQGFKGNWGCSVTATFTPTAGNVYRATLQTQNDNASCALQIVDQNGASVPAVSPEYSCTRTLAGIVRNGTRWAK